MSFESGYDQLLETIQEGKLKALERLLWDGKLYNVNEKIPFRSEEGKQYIITPLYWAVRWRQKEICRYLLKNGANPWKHMVYDYYPLHQACSQGDTAIVEEFINSSGCNLDIVNIDCDTALHIACMRGHIECVTKLLQAGANPSLRNAKGHTPLEAAQYNNHGDLFPLFKQFVKGIEDSSPKKWNDEHPPKVPSPERVLERRRSHSSIARIHSFPKSPRPNSLQDYPQQLQDYHTSFAPSFLPHAQKLTSSREENSCQRSRVDIKGTSPRPYRSHSNRDPSRARLNQSPLTRRKVSPAKPMLGQYSHDSQLTLPTQNLIADTRRTKTVPDFGSSLLVEDFTDRDRLGAHHFYSSNDDIEVDHGKKGRPVSFSPEGKVQKLSEVLISSMGTSNSEQLGTIVNQLMSALYSEVGLSEEEHTSLRTLAGDIEETMEGEARKRRRRRRRRRLSQLEMGVDYDFVDHQPVAITENMPTVGCGRLTFRTHFVSEQSSSDKRHNSIMKVTVKLFNLVDKEEADRYHSGCFGDIPTMEGEILESLPHHPHIAKLLGYCVADSSFFEKFTCLFCQEQSHRTLKMSSHASVVVLDEYTSTLSDYIKKKQQTHSLPPYGFDEGRITMILAQLLLAMAHLDKHGVIMSTVTSADLYIDDRRLLVTGDFSTCVDLLHQQPEDIRNKLREMPQEVLLTFPPELCHLCDCPPSEVLEGEEGRAQLRQILSKCNAYVAARLILHQFTLHSSLDCILEEFRSPSQFSPQLSQLLRMLVATDPKHRLTAFEGAMCCLVLLFGPQENIYSEEDCKQWLLSHALHFFLLPSMKGKTSSQSSEQHTKLRYTYLTLASPSRIWKAINQLKSFVNSC